MNDKQNSLIIVGLFILAYILVAGYFFTIKTDKTMDQALILIISNIAAGMTGYLAKGNNQHGTSGTPSDPVVTTPLNDKPTEVKPAD